MSTQIAQSHVGMYPSDHGWELRSEHLQPTGDRFSSLAEALREASIHARRHATSVHIYGFDGQMVDLALFLGCAEPDDYVVLPHGREWLLKHKKHAGYTTFEKKSDALDRARLLARHSGSRVHVYYRDGTLQKTIDYSA